ncbi:immunoglobulin domain-containing protein [Flavivirga aquimarina]|uniref:Immunoglobulin domain-containing protein n=1 Tax=Flavivirga aquimarina TaxID=2027862 RepID=A0ABT8WG11_9FLAO|nr:immunoglobulin domain-containing protein [Flavivirga aquimarina]MDO5971993.1 immunoglobulin domain-containing protein [Flavivirga aquimarina]
MKSIFSNKIRLYIMKKTYYHIILLVSFLLFSISNSFGQCASDVPTTERDALIALYNATNGANWTNNTNWDTTACVSDWYGVTVVNNTVIEIYLSNNQLSGDIPVEIGNLTNLTDLILERNQLTGNIPAAIGNLTNLTDLILERNQLSGNIPIEIGNLSNLTVLNLNFNQLTNIPAEIGNLINLTELNLGINQLAGNIPTEIGNLTNLTELNLGTNQLTGNIPIEIGNLTNLTDLLLEQNQLTGNIPAAIGNLTNLTDLILERNQLSGNIPIEIGNLSNLTGLYLNINQLTGNIPAEIGSLTNLINLSIPNNQLTGNIPAEMGNLTNLTNLTLSSNQLTGNIPTEIGDLTLLKKLKLGSNNLYGNIPSSLTSLTALLDFDIKANAFVFRDFESDYNTYNNLAYFKYNLQAKVGQVETPTALEGNSYTFTTSLSSPNNSYQWYKDGVAITGAISKDYTINSVALADAGVYHVLATNSIVTGLTLERNTITLAVTAGTCSVSTAERDALMALYNATDGANWTNTLANNQPWDINTPVCDWYGVTVVNGSVTQLRLPNNQLVGTIPTELGNLSDLEFLHLSTNQLTGSIPISLGGLIKLKTLWCDENNLSGTIPSELGNLSNLENLSLLSNQLTGAIPSSLGSLSLLLHFYLSSNQLAGEIPTELSTLSNLITFDFQSNAFIFSDFETEHPTYTNITTYNYAPQAKVDQIETPTVTEGSSYTFTTSLSSSNNSYQWYKDGVAITGATSKDYTINSLTLTDAGVYHVIATNSIVTGLTLERNTVTLSVTSNTCSVPTSERDALMALYNATDGSNWANTLINYQPWSINIPVCDWYGVVVTNGVITGVHLTNNQLVGSIPINIGDLSNLTELYLDNNQLNSTIPSQLGNLSNLTRLLLRNNQLTGSIPSQLGSLSNLIVLDLGANGLEGNIPVQLGNLTNLGGLNLGLNNLEGDIPPELGTLLNLEQLYLLGNELTGSIPTSFENLSNLERLWISYNKLTGDIPSGFINLSLLNEFAFRENAFVFSDFEIEHPTYTNIGTYNYAPQAKVDQEETINVTEGNPFTLTTSLTSPNNHYQWEFSNDGGATFNPIGTDLNTYSVNSATTSNAGIYRFFATNDVVTGLTLERHTITVNVNPDSPTNPTYCSEKVSAELALKNLLNHLINEVKAGTVIPAFYNPTEMQALAPYINCENPAIYNFQYLSGEGGAWLTFSYGANCCQQNIYLYWTVCKDTVGVGGQDIIDGLAPILGISVNESRTFQLKYDFTINCSATYYSDSRGHLPSEEAMSCLSINYDGTCNPNAFCYSQLEDYPTVADLTPWGSDIIWYSAETGGQQYSNTDDLIDEAAISGGVTYWWDDTTDSIVTRTAANVEVFIDIEGDHEQLFSKYAPAPTLADIDVVNSGAPIYWYENDSSTAVLNIDTPLEDGQTYYASSCNSGGNSCFCRFPVTITIGVIPPKGDSVQYLCEQSTLDDIVLEIENINGMSVLWYDGNGNPLAVNTPVVDGTTYYVAQIDGNNEESADRLAILVHIKSTDDPIITQTNQTFYATDPPPKVKDLKAKGIEILWYSQSTGGLAYDPEFNLVNETTYYAEQVFDGCASISRIAVTVNIEAEPAQPLLGCELFRPEFLKHYVVDAWVNEREVTTEETSEVLFNGSKESELFVALLNHLKNRLMSGNEKLVNIPEVYEPEFTGEEEQLDLAPLMAYVEGVAVSEKKFIVYDFKTINDDYGRAIGFSFYLNEAKTSGTQFIYRTPTFTYTIPKEATEIGTGVTLETKEEHYPLLDNITTSPDEYLRFTDVKVTALGVFEMYANFHQTSDPILEESQKSTFSDPNVMKSESTYYKYKEVPYQAIPTYTKANIEISFVTEDNEAIGDPLVFNTDGDIIDKWQKITGDFTVPNGAGKMIISLKNGDDNKVAYFDDLRIYPYEGNMKSFVYHPENQRLMSELDENNYATFYEYDPEGGLIRVKKETVKGIYTIQETRSGNIKATN